MWTRANRLLTFGAVAALIVAARLPFLLLAERFFDSDEAVEGLMALHVLRGEFPAFFWGQHYKGVPDIYPLAILFALFGPSVTVLKASTLAWFAAFACAQFALMARLHSARTAWLSVLFLAATPPALVQWSLSGNAEFAIIMLAGAVLVHAWYRWRTSGSSRALAVAAFAFGFGLWVQQFIVYYVLALAATELLATRQPVRWAWHLLVPDVPQRSLHAILRTLLAIAVLYLILGAVAFGGGFSFQAGGVSVSVTHAQKMWRVSAALLVIVAVGGWIASGGLATASVRHTVRVALAWAALGYAPALVHRLATGRGGPIAGMDLEAFRSAVVPIATVLVPIIAGFRSGSTEVLSLPAWTAAPIVVALIAAFLPVRTRAGPEHRPSLDIVDFFRVFGVLTPLVFLASGSYVDVQSYRYLLPLYGALPVLLAVGVDRVWRRQPWVAVGLAAALASLFAWQQIAWYARIHPDARAAAQLTCIEDAGITHAYADYWDSYKLTFLTGERVIVAQSPRPDRPTRYPPYDEAVAAHGGRELSELCP